VKPTERTTIADTVARCSLQLTQGDPAALARLYDAAGARLLRYSQSLTRNREDAEDALQAAMVKVAQNPHKMASAKHPWAYFLRIVRNETLKLLGRRRPTQTLIDTTVGASPDSLDAEREESRQFVHEALKKLPAEQTEVVVLKIWEQMTFQEIAVVLGESINTTASRYRYALEKLSRYLRPIAEEVPYES
jgi:RNA polymerase sigma-70 factor, ECF subfamily